MAILPVSYHWKGRKRESTDTEIERVTEAIQKAQREVEHAKRDLEAVETKLVEALKEREGFGTESGVSEPEGINFVL